MSSSLPSSALFSAPGKIMLCGEYAILDGAKACVMAVDKRAYGHLALAPSRIHPEADEAFYRQVPEHQWHVALDISAQRGETQKFGLGSSAAGAAIGSALALDALNKSPNKEEVFENAFAAHHQVSRGGSGADVAAAVYGGVIEYALKDGVPSVSSVQAQTLPMSVVWTGKEAKTSSFLKELEVWKHANPNSYEHILEEMKKCADAFLDSYREGEQERLFHNVASYQTLMDELGQQTGLPIVEETLREIDREAKSLGACSKPSGAGGGDIALVFFPTLKEQKRFAQKTKFTLLEMSCDPFGVKEEEVSGA